MDEAYDRCEELSRKGEKLKTKVAEMEAEALGDKVALEKARFVQRCSKMFDVRGDSLIVSTHRFTEHWLNAVLTPT